ncbi:hypothetical protein [Clostridium perfringens]|uniref:hypothetical protein n=1 Tax=Clostridium perfringens TaxID=1502 RepID=UPI0039E996C0
MYKLLIMMESNISLSFYNSCEEHEYLNSRSIIYTFDEIDMGIKIALDNIRLIDIL